MVAASSSNDSSSAKSNALGEVLEFLESRQEGDEWYCPSYLASKECLNLPQGTVRVMLRKLLQNNKVYVKTKVNITFMRLSNVFLMTSIDC